jgi:hypothetical protein
MDLWAIAVMAVAFLFPFHCLRDTGFTQKPSESEDFMPLSPLPGETRVAKSNSAL